MQLFIGNKNYSSWSLRGWLVLKAFAIEFSEQKLRLFSDEFYAELEKVSRARKVPVLVDGERIIWDSLAICEYVNEQYLDAKGWPEDVADRAEARAVCCEMHSGFMALRDALPMNCRARRRVEFIQAVHKDIQRVEEIWISLRSKHAARGPWLFGEFSIADIMFAPVVLRFKTYGVELGKEAQAYMQSVLQHPAVQEWLQGAACETDIVPQDEAGEGLP